MPLGIYVPARWNDLAVDVDVGTPAQGAVPYFGGTKWNALAAGADGQVLTSGGAAADPAWETLPATDYSPAVILAPAASARNVIQPTGATVVPLAARGASGQSADLQQWQNDAGTVLSLVDSTGRLGIGTTALETASLLKIRQGSSTNSLTGTSAGRLLLDVQTGADSGASERGFAIHMEPGASAGATRSFRAVEGNALIPAGDTKTYTNTSAVVGLLFQSYNRGDSPGSVVATKGVWVLSGKQTGSGGQTHAYGVDAQVGIFAGGSGTLANAYALYVRNASTAGTGVITTQYGLYIENQTVGATSYAIRSLGGQSLLETGAAGVKGVVIRGAASQSANLQEWQNSATTVLAAINASGQFTGEAVGSVVLAPATSARNVVQPSADVIPLSVRGSAGQTANLQEWQNSAGAAVAYITSGGGFFLTNGIAAGAGVPIVGSQVGVDSIIAIYNGVNQLWRMRRSGSDLHFDNGSTGAISMVKFIRSGAVADTLVVSGGKVAVGAASATAKLDVIGSDAATVGQIVKGAASQSADLHQWQNSSGRRLLAVPAAGDLLFYRDSSTPAERQAADITVTFATATDASRKARAVFNVWDTAAREALRLEASGTAPMIGFLGAAASARVAITGSRGGNAALASLLTELASKGLITDSTTA